MNNSNKYEITKEEAIKLNMEISNLPTIKEILESIYEPLFSNNSHGFRPNRSCQTALFQIKRTCIGSSWAIEGDIQGFFDTIDHDILISILKQKIGDGRIIELIRRFLKAGYINEGITYNTLTGTPQGGIITPPTILQKI